MNSHRQGNQYPNRHIPDSYYKYKKLLALRAPVSDSFRLYPYNMKENSMQHSSWLFDEPITDKYEDKYQRAEYTQNLADTLLNSTDPNGLIIGIHGPWGSGKTSLKNMLINALKASENTNKCHIIEFEPWMYSGSGQVVSLLFKQIAQTLFKKTNSVSRTALQLAAFSNRWSSLLSALSNLVSSSSSYTINLIATFFNNIGDYLNPYNPDMQVLAEQRGKLKKKLNATKTKIIVFIDDLDRLTDAEIAEMLRAVKAVGDLPYVTYVLLYDRDVVTKSLDKTYHNKGDEYLEKIIQVPIGIPEPPRDVIEKMLTSEIENIIQFDTREPIALSSSDLSPIPFIDIGQTCIAPFVNNLRDAIRLTNEFKIRYQVLKDDVEPGDLLGITSLEVFRPSLYRWIIEHKNLICSHNAPSTLTSRLSTETSIDHISDKLEELLKNMELSNGEIGKQDSEAVKALFPFAKASTSRYDGQKNISRTYLDPNGADRHIFRPEHFDAYFRLSVEQNKLHENGYKEFLLYDPLRRADIDKRHWDIFKDSLFAGKAGKYLGNSENNRAAKVIAFCLDLEAEYSSFNQGYTTLNVVLSILNAGNGYKDYETLFDALTQQILDSDSPLSLVLCAYLAYRMHTQLSPEAGTEKIHHKINYLSGDLPHIYILDSLIQSNDWENNINVLYNKLCDRLKTWDFKSTKNPLSGKVMSIYANCIPALFDKNEDQYAAFIVLSHMVDKEHFILFTLDALVQKDGAKYVMNLPLIQQLINADAYKATITKLINDISFRNDFDGIINFDSVAAYRVVLQNAISANSVSAGKVATVVEEWRKQINTQSSPGPSSTVYA